MISQGDDSEEINVERVSSRKRPLGSMDYAIGTRDNQYSYSLSPPTTTTTTTSRIPVPSLGPLPSTHPSTIPKPIPRPRIPQYPFFFFASLFPRVIFSHALSLPIFSQFLIHIPSPFTSLSRPLLSFFLRHLPFTFLPSFPLVSKYYSSNGSQCFLSRIPLLPYFSKFHSHIPPIPHPSIASFLPFSFLSFSL